jgi:sugar phosphate isomerase/epimerase
VKLGYISNGFRDHRLADGFALLRDLGYEAVGLTLDVGHFDDVPPSAAEVARLRSALGGLHPVVETGARYVLDPRRKHRPTLLSADPSGRERRVDYLRAATDLAAEIGAGAVSFWSGARDPDTPVDDAWRNLLDGLAALADHAETRGVALGFEPEPGMFIESLADFRELRRRFADDRLQLTLDLGHLECTETAPHDRWIDEFADVLVNVHVDDIRGGVHDHLPLGDGDLDFPPIFAALKANDYQGACLVELGRHSHAFPIQAQRSIEAMRGYSTCR